MFPSRRELLVWLRILKENCLELSSWGNVIIQVLIKREGEVRVRRSCQGGVMPSQEWCQWPRNVDSLFHLEKTKERFSCSMSNRDAVLPAGITSVSHHTWPVNYILLLRSQSWMIEVDIGLGIAHGSGTRSGQTISVTWPCLCSMLPTFLVPYLFSVTDFTGFPIDSVSSPIFTNQFCWLSCFQQRAPI
jgi:hypothetical protein